MSYKALLFCPDATAAHLVTQVLSELDFTVEPAAEPFAAVKKLSNESFDALVVDCENEQNASVLFKGARSSSVNHSALCVAVVEGQAGVAKAFRIGANLVLTKPINMEQSKGTLRVARGLLRKSDPKPAIVPPSSKPVSQEPAPTSPISGGSQVPAAPLSFAASAAASASPAPSAPVAAPFSMIEVEQEPVLAPEASEVALLESMPNLAGQPEAIKQSSTPASKTSAGPIAASSSGHAAAAAPALAPVVDSAVKPAAEVKTALPLATQEAIFPETTYPEPSEAPVPFSSYGQDSTPSRGSGKAFWVILLLMALSTAGYFGWKKLQPLHYLSRHAPVSDTQWAPSSEPAQAPAAPSTPAEQETNTSDSNSAANILADPSPRTLSTGPGPEGFPTKETIDVTDTPETPEPTKTVAPKPLQVRTKPAPSTGAQVAPAPPALSLSESDTSNSALAGIVSANAVVPKAAPGSLRVSQGVSQGLLVKKVSPVYPPSALQMHKQGTVELLATVSKEGTITGVKVLKGDSTLGKSASDAVRQWKYRPYLLNGEPVTIETQITINFRLPN